MRKLALTVTVLALAAAVGASPVLAEPPLATQPYNQAIYDAQVRDLIKRAITATPDPAVPAHLDTPKVETGMVQARQASRVLPTMRALGTISMGVTAFTIGWKIGTATYMKFFTPAPDTAGGITGWHWVWKNQGSYPSPYCAGGGVNISGSGWCWVLRADLPSPVGGREKLIPAGAADITGYSSCGGCVTAMNTAKNQAPTVPGAVPFPAGNGRTVANEYNAVTPTATSNSVVVIYSRTDSQLTAALGVRPSTSTEYDALPSGQKLTQSYTVPSDAGDTAGDLAAIRAALDAADDPDVRTYINLHLDPDYDDGALTMPNCIGLSEAGCNTALDTAGHVGTRTYVELETETANPDYDPGAVVTQSIGASAALGTTTTVTFTKNPTEEEMPFEILQPQPNETYTAYIARLETEGWLGTATSTELTTADSGFGPESVVRVIIGARVLSPTSWPTTAVRVAAATDITLRYNPSTAPEVPTEGATGTPVTVPPTTVPPGEGIDFGPISDIDFGCKFPYGLFCYAVAVTETFDIAPDAPVFDLGEICVTIPSAGSKCAGPYVVDLNVMDDYMSLWRSILSVCLWVGAVYLIASRLLGWHAGGDPGAAIDDVV